MKTTRFYLSLAAAMALQPVATAPAGEDAAKKMIVPMAEADFGQITFGGKFSEDLQSGYADILSGLFHSKENAFFLNVRGTFADDDQQILSVGLGFRHLFEDPGIILGGNIYYDYIDSENGNGFNQLGLGAEILTKWVDARFNYYLPDGDRHEVGRFSTNQNSRAVGAPFGNGGLIQQGVRNTNTRSDFAIYEEGLEGWNAEIGFLVPGLDKYFDLRLFAGAYSYNDPKGDLTGFKARMEARVTEGVTLDLEYWDDKSLVGGHWVGGVRVSVPFDIGNLFTGKNPFEGAGEIFHRRQPHTLADRMDEMVIRSHRIQTSNSNPEPAGGGTTTTTDTVTVGKKKMPPLTPPPTPSGGGDEGPSGEGSLDIPNNERPPT